MIKLIQAFCSNSSIHGLHLIVSKGITIKERVMWGALLTLTGGLLIYIFLSLVDALMHSSVEMIVDNPTYPVHKIDFPAVTICPNSKVMKGKLESYVARLGLTDEERLRMYNTAIALDMMKYPFYQHPFLFIHAYNHSVHPINNTQIFPLMYQVKPDLLSIMKNCRWRGLAHSCDKLFRQQLTEEGFCHSFNSKTSERTDHQELSIPPTKLADGSLEALRNNAAGKGSGLMFELKSLDNDVFKENMITRGYSITIHDPNTYPDVSHKSIIFHRNYTVTRFNVRVSIVKADHSLSKLPSRSLKCQLHNKRDTNSCYLDCRKQELLKRCDCLPYFMHSTHGNVEVCGLQHVDCLRSINIRLRNSQMESESYSFPAWSIVEMMNCTCVQPCAYTVYKTELTHLTKAETTGTLTMERPLGSVEVVYKSVYATSYIKRASFSESSLLVSMGGFASLLLGCSLISLIEILLLCFKLAKEMYLKILIKRNKVHNLVN